MSYYNITISVDEKNAAQKQFLNLFKKLCEENSAFSIKPMKTKIFTSDCLFFDDVNSPTYNEICKVADAGSFLEMNITSINRLDEYTDEINNIISEKCEDMIDTISKLMKGIPEENEHKEDVKANTVDVAYDSKEAESEENHEVENNSEGSLEDKDGKPSESEPTEAPDSNEDSNDDEEEYTLEESDDMLDEDLSMDDSDPDFDPEDEAPKVPEGKLYPDKYEFSMLYNEFYEKTEKERQDIIHSEVGWHELSDRPLESLKTWQTRDFHSYSNYLLKYPEMDSVDKPIYWLRSYTNYVLSRDIYSGDNNERESFYTFDSFIRAKLNRDIKCEEMVKLRIDSLYK